MLLRQKPVWSSDHDASEVKYNLQRKYFDKSKQLACYLLTEYLEFKEKSSH